MSKNKCRYKYLKNSEIQLRIEIKDNKHLKYNNERRIIKEKKNNNEKNNKI